MGKAKWPRYGRRTSVLKPRRLAQLDHWVAVRARSSMPAVVPMYMSRVVRTLACPAMAETSVASSFQVNKAVVHRTCRRLCQVQGPLPAGPRQPAAR